MLRLQISLLLLISNGRAKMCYGEFMKTSIMSHPQEPTSLKCAGQRHTNRQTESYNFNSDINVKMRKKLCYHKLTYLIVC